MKFIVREGYAYFKKGQKAPIPAGQTVELDDIHEGDQAWKLEPVGDEEIVVAPGDKVGLVHEDGSVTDAVVTEDGGIKDLGTEVDLGKEAVEAPVEAKQGIQLFGKKNGKKGK